MNRPSLDHPWRTLNYDPRTHIWQDMGTNRDNMRELVERLDIPGAHEFLRNEERHE